MQNHRATQSTAPPQQIGIGKQFRELLLQKLWLPRVMYEAMPFLYIVLGIFALVSAIYIPDWTWVFPYAILFGLICLHAGLGIVTLRYKLRKRKPSRRDNT